MTRTACAGVPGISRVRPLTPDTARVLGKPWLNTFESSARDFSIATSKAIQLLTPRRQSGAQGPGPSTRAGRTAPRLTFAAAVALPLHPPSEFAVAPPLRFSWQPPLVLGLHGR